MNFKTANKKLVTNRPKIMSSKGLRLKPAFLAKPFFFTPILTLSKTNHFTATYENKITKIAPIIVGNGEKKTC